MKSRRSLATLGVLLVSSLLARHAGAADTYVGSLLLYQLKEVTVVYPAAAGAQQEQNRLSAVRRAAFLEKVHGIKTRVLRDEDVSAEDRNAHLLLLGWDNKLLGTETAPKPFQHSRRGLSMLGLSDPDPDADLVFCHESPYAPRRWLIFWSRIDPERDRFMPLPRVGSDWAVLHDYAIVNQGMFTSSSGWPPARNTDAEKSHAPELAAAAGHESVRKTEHFDIRYDPAVIGDAEIQAIAKAREAAYARAVKALGAPPPAFRISLTVYKDEKEKKERTGVEDATHSLPARREMHLVRRAARWEPPHEETHVIARAILGPAYATSLYEGLALSVDGAFRSMDLGVHAALLTDRGIVPPLASLLDEEKMRSLPDEVGYPAAGLLVDWLRSIGPESLKRIYGIPECTPTAIGRVLGKSAEDLEGSYRAFVAAAAGEHGKDVAFLKAEEDAKKRQLVGDYAGVAAALEKALTIRPDDPQTLFNIAAADLRSGAFADAETKLRRLLGLPLKPAESRFVIFGHYQMGRLYDVQGKRQEAIAEYRKVLSLEDQKDAHRLAQEAIERPVTREQLD